MLSTRLVKTQKLKHNENFRKFAVKIATWAKIERLIEDGIMIPMQAPIIVLFKDYKNIKLYVPTR